MPSFASRCVKMHLSECEVIFRMHILKAHSAGCSVAIPPSAPSLFWTQLLWHILMCHQNAQPLIQYFSGFCSAPELLHTTLSLAHLLFSFLHYSSYCILLRSVHIMLHCILVCTASYDYQQRLLFLPHLYARRTLPQFAIFSTHIAARALFVK